MRPRLILLTAATTWLVALAFLVPLALLVRTLASDRAMGAAELEAQSLAPVLALTDDPHVIQPAIEATTSGAQGRLTIFLDDGRSFGAPADRRHSLALARQGRTFSTPAPGGTEVLVPVVVGDGSTAVVRVLVPSEALHRGVGQAWLVLVALGVALVLLALVFADRMARSIVGPVERLAEAAHRLGEGDLEVRVTPEGPPEIAEVGRAFNRVAGRVKELLAAEREAVADLSHRLRTPLTALRLDTEILTDPEERRRIAQDAEELERVVDRIIIDARRPIRGGMASSTDLNHLARQRVEFWAALAEEQGRRWSIETPDAALPVPVDSDDLEAALDALLGNVFAHTPDGSGFRVLVEAGQEGEARIIVEDEGPGFQSEAVVARGASGAGSTGLGLDIARRTAEAAGGSLRVVGTGNGGGRVEMEFPPHNGELPR
ncbi:MAG: HAMP domain-containing histidine kinase [Actinobacteria bacterium]|nr:HAMP domain-containing histidine kinase [Actinomycetota bacterium]MBW3649599.1 HAMP domain-containing histidine kinase [Actinomycetota bacterium]